MSDDAKQLGKAEAKASHHDEPNDEVEAHAKPAARPGQTDEAIREDEVEAHLFKQQGKADAKTA